MYEFPQKYIEQIDKIKKANLKEIDSAKTLFLATQFSQDFSTNLHDKLNQLVSYKNFISTAKELELFGLDYISRHYKNKEIVTKSWRELLWSAYRVRRSISAHKGHMKDLNNTVNKIVDGLLANRQPELRYELSKHNICHPFKDFKQTLWDEYLYLEIIRAFLLLVRKGDGYNDIKLALEIISNLKDMQLESENSYLTNMNNLDRLELSKRVSILVALYNLARVVEITGEFLIGKYEDSYVKPLSAKGIKGEIDKHIMNAREALSGRICPKLRIFAKKLGKGCKALVESSIFSIMIPTRSKEFLMELSKDKNRPVLELWYSQREAIKNSLLDPAKSAIVISMPTSSGKTLLAELAIIQAKNDYPKHRIVYLAPTKALVTQISLTLRKHLGKHMKVRIATPTYEINPIENEILQDDFDILVTTPEKMDILLKSDHEAVRKISLVIVDEAHNMNDGGRGAKLELLLATLRRERSMIKFVLLTPFASNASDVAYWLGEEQGASIIVDWKPNDRVVGVVTKGKKVRNKNMRYINFETLKTTHSDFPEGKSLSLGCFPYEHHDINTKERLCIESALAWAKAKDGGVLILCSSRKKAEEWAEKLASRLPKRKVSKSVDLVCRFLQTELGDNHDIVKMIKKGVAFHHAGLSPESRYFIERLIEEKEIKILCATTTLAQGVNFPLSVVIVESYIRRIRKRGRWLPPQELKPWEFWNIAGRAGRTFEDSLGTVAFIASDDNQKTRIQDYLKKDATIISSALMQLIKELDGKPIIFNTDLVREVEQASAFMQYLLHALSVSGIEEVKDDLEGILRASFVYEEARTENPKLAEELIRIARLYIQDLESKKGNALQGFAKLTDGTGFSSPSVEIILNEWKRNATYGVDDWNTNRLFPEDAHSSILNEAIKTLSKIPEIRLGSEDEGSFSSERIARVISAWVNGKTISEIAKKEYKNDLLKCTHHIYTKITNSISWGLRAIQRVMFAGNKDIDLNELDMIPAMIYHGVKSKEAIALRMMNVPRFIAEGMAKQLRKEGISLRQVPEWLSNTQTKKWDKALPKEASLSGDECKRLWEVFEGKRSWENIFD